MATATLLLPERARLASQRLPAELALWLARADRSMVDGDQRRRVFDILPRGWPAAAVTRQRDAGDAVHAAWLRADPAYVRPDINGARLLAYGEALSLGSGDSEALLRELRPLFGDAGFPIDAPTPSRWYVCVPRGAKLPVFADPDEALGADLFDHLPGSDQQDSSEGRRWRALLSEAQVVLHNHPRNAERIASGLPPVNSLWFWGAGALPDHVRSDFTRVYSDDDAWQAFASLAKVTSAPLPKRWQAGDGAAVFDLRAARDLAALQSDWFSPVMNEMRAGRIADAIFDFADGVRYTLTGRQRWRFWRRPLRVLDA